MSDLNTNHNEITYLPQTVSQAIARLMDVCENSLLVEIRDGSESDLYMHHFGMGLWIRNNLGLWAGNSSLMSELECYEPDAASHALLTRLRATLQDWKPPLDENDNIVVKYPQEDEQNSDGIEIIDLGDGDPDEQAKRAMQVIKDVFGLENENPN